MVYNIREEIMKGIDIMAEFLLSAFADEAGGGLLDQIKALKERA